MKLLNLVNGVDLKTSLDFKKLEGGGYSYEYFFFQHVFFLKYPLSVPKYGEIKFKILRQNNLFHVILSI